MAASGFMRRASVAVEGSNLWVAAEDGNTVHHLIDGGAVPDAPKSLMVTKSVIQFDDRMAVMDLEHRQIFARRRDEASAQVLRGLAGHQLAEGVKASKLTGLHRWVTASFALLAWLFDEI